MELKNALYERDGYLMPYKADIDRRHLKMIKTSKMIESAEGMDFFTKSYDSFGLHLMGDNSVQGSVRQIFSYLEKDQ